MDIELEKLKKLEHALCDAIDILRDWQVEEVKPEEEKWIVYLAREENGICYLTSCSEYMWKTVQKIYGTKTKLFIGTESEAQHWYKTREKFTKVIEAWEDGKRIQVTPKGTDKWVDLHCKPTWGVDLKYRVKPECPCEEGIDSKACAGCLQDEERKQTFRPFKDCDELVEFWSKNYQTGFRPAYIKPFIWVRVKVDKRERLIVAYGDNFVEIGNKTKAVTLQHLFEQYEFLDESPCGMEVKE